MRILVTVFAVLALSTPAHADIGPARTSPCDGLADRAPCIRDDGTAGVCERREPFHGRAVTLCVAGADECERLAVGDACHGLGHRPAHCREFHDSPTSGARRACVVDEFAAPLPSVDAGMPASPAAPPPAPSPSSRSHCAVAPRRVAASWPIGRCVVLAAFGVLGLRRRRAIR